MCILGAGSSAAIGLRKAKSYGDLPGPEVYFLRSLAWLFHGGLEVASKLQLSNFAAHRADQGEVVGVRRPRLIAKDVPAGVVHSEGREADGPITQRVEEELAKAVAPAGFRNPQRIVGTVIGAHRLPVERGIIGIDIRADHVDGWSQRTPQSHHLLHRAAAGV